MGRIMHYLLFDMYDMCLKKCLLLIYLSVAIPQLASAQENTKWTQYADVSFSAGKSSFSAAGAWSNLYGVGSKQKFSIGYGVRYTFFTGKEQEYITAPAKLTSGKTGPQVLFIENIEANLDTFRVNKPLLHVLNLAIYLQYQITEQFSLGFNIDALGISLGSQVNGSFTSGLIASKPTFQLQARPTILNALLISDNDRGSLNSELLAKYQFNEHFGIKVGLTFIFTEYTTTSKPILDNDRFRNKALMGLLGASYRF